MWFNQQRNFTANNCWNKYRHNCRYRAIVCPNPLKSLKRVFETLFFVSITNSREVNCQIQCSWMRHSGVPTWFMITLFILSWGLRVFITRLFGYQGAVGDSRVSVLCPAFAGAEVTSVTSRSAALLPSISSI